MKQSLFNPNRIECPGPLILNAKFWDTDYYNNLKKSAAYHFPLMGCEIVVFNDFTLVSGFLGYPQIITLLEFIKDFRQKDIYFLGTAGSLTDDITQSCVLTLKEMHASAIFDYFCQEKVLDLEVIDHGDARVGTGVSVDLIQRETVEWLRAQEAKKIDVVEMEIFPLRVFLDKPFPAIVVTTDRVSAAGVKQFPDHKHFLKEFVKGYELIVRTINEKKSHTN